MRDDRCLAFFVDHRERRARSLRMRREVEVGAVRQAAQFFAAERKVEFKIDRTLRIVCALPVRHFQLMHRIARDTYRTGKREDLLPPFFKCFLPLRRSNEILDLHLLQLPHAENKITRGYFIPERLADLRDAERELRVERVHDVLEVDEDAARGLGPQVRNGCRFFRRAHVRPEHHVELPHIADSPSAFRTLPCPELRRGVANLVRTEPSFAFLALDQGVGEPADVPAGLPHVGVHEDGRVDAVHVVATVDEHSPPDILDVVLERDSQGTVVPRAGEPAVDLRPRIDKAAAFCEGDQFFHCYVTHTVRPSVPRWRMSPKSPGRPRCSWLRSEACGKRRPPWRRPRR